MRRKLIKQDAFDKITNESVTTAQRELVEASPILAKTLGKDALVLRSFTESTVVYETLDHTYVHAAYQIKEGRLDFNNIEELVIDETSRRDSMKKIIAEMVDQVVQDNHEKAKDLFQNYLGMVHWREFNENRKSQRKVTNESNQNIARKSGIAEAVRAAGRDIHDAYTVAQNVLEYVNFMKLGPALTESVMKSDDRGNVTDVRVPTISERNNDRIKRMGFRVPNAEAHDIRKKVPELTSEQEFCKAVANLKRQNAFSDQSALEESLDQIVKNWPNVLYVTESELSKLVSEALQNVGVSNYDDQTCDFMAEAILRRAHDVYTEKVSQILYLANAPKAQNEDQYAHFQGVVEQFYPALDEKFGLERKAFSDLYEALEVIYKKAEKSKNSDLKHECAVHLNELAAALNGKIKPEMEMIEEAAQWLARLIESNVEGATSWNVSNKAHMTVTGDHPDMAKKATVAAIPGKYKGDWGDEAPAIGQDSMDYKSGKHAKTMRNNSWGQEGGKNVFPHMSNPYIPKPFGDYTMKGEKGVDKEATGQHWSTWQSGDTWPNLKNPMVPKEAGGTGGKGYKMKNGKETDLIVDK